MSWAEFVLRSIGFKEHRDFKMEMTRAVAYQGYVGNHAFSKKNPKPMDVWWPIRKKKRAGLTDDQKEAFKLAQEAYLKKKQGS